MMGYGMDSSWKCNDCGEVSHSTPLGQPSRLQREARLKKKNFKGCRNEWHAGPPVTMSGDVTVACPTCGEKAPEQFLKMAARKSKKK